MFNSNIHSSNVSHSDEKHTKFCLCSRTNSCRCYIVIDILQSSLTLSCTTAQTFFLALSLKAFLALEHKIPIINPAHKDPIGLCWTPKRWKKPATPDLIAESPGPSDMWAAIQGRRGQERCSGSVRVLLCWQFQKTPSCASLILFKVHKTAIGETERRLCVL